MNIFQIKTKPHGIERCNQFINEGFICVGWPGIGDLSKTSKDEIRNRLEQKYRYTGHKLGNALGQVNTFVNTMADGDIVLVAEKGMVNVGKVGCYSYESQYDNEDDGMCHQRSVEWIKRVKLDELSGDIQKLIGNRNTICQYPYSVNESELDSVLGKKVAINNENSDKLNNLFSEALKVLGEELKSDDAERRIKAATEVLKLKDKNLL